MRLQMGDKVTGFQLAAIDNTTFDLDDLQEKRCMLPFFRCAGYPFCNRQMHQLVSRYGELGSNFN
ncbi:MAG: peroxiredoxin family protein, partial [Gammaproteobacteria bacterium]|nr:peroxiredoxin family protein [Gammaproteobacteria bacterium]